MSNSASPIPGSWLASILEGASEPPRLYAWTPANLSGSNPPAQTSAPGSNVQNASDERRRIHVLGVGNLGRLFAISLAKQVNRPPITLVVHRKALLEHWINEPGVEMTRVDQTDKITDFDIEYWTPEKPSSGPIRELSPIRNLIVATKAPIALPEVDRLRRYLYPHSTIAFTQNGMCKLWPPMGDAYIRARFPAATTPNWIVCVTTHGVTSVGPFRSIHASPAGISLGPVILSPQGASSADYLMETIRSTQQLAAVQVSRRELWVFQLEKLVVNSIINPLTAVLRCKNGEIIVDRDDGLPKLIDALIREASNVLSALVTDFSTEAILKDVGEPVAASTLNLSTDFQEAQRQLLERFSFPKLRNMVLGVAEKVKDNTSSMLQDVQAGKTTEIRDFNGWLIESAEYLDKNITVESHETLVRLVEEQATLSRNEILRNFPNII